MMKTREFFSMALNMDKQLDKQVSEVLKTCPTHSKCEYVKNAIIAYAQKEELKDTLRCVLSEYSAINTSQNTSSYSEPDFISPTQKNTRSKKAKNFMASLQTD